MKENYLLGKHFKLEAEKYVTHTAHTRQVIPPQPPLRLSVLFRQVLSWYVYSGRRMGVRGGWGE